jgi:hypothetical protein
VRGEVANSRTNNSREQSRTAATQDPAVGLEALRRDESHPLRSLANQCAGGQPDSAGACDPNARETRVCRVPWADVSGTNLR